MQNPKVNQAIIDIWNEYASVLGQDLLAPIFYDDFKKDRPILFIGLNPSFSVKGNGHIHKGTAYENYDYKWQTVSKGNPEKYVQAELEMAQKAYEKYSIYFKKFKEIAKYLNLEWEHIDLFFYRQTSQKDFKKFICSNKKQTELTDFGKKQLEISLSMIESIRPKIILVANADASRIIKENLKINSDDFDKLGFNTIKIDGHKVPIFFSSMISGQRALDNNSFERLKWHMKQSLECKWLAANHLI